MPKVFLSVIIFLISFFSTGQNIRTSKQKIPKDTYIYHKLGETTIIIKLQEYESNKDIFFINLHDDEITAVSGATKLLQLYGGTLLKLENNRNRNIRFRLDGRNYAFDPNRIFSRTGIIQTLSTFGSTSNKAIHELELFARRVLELLPEKPGCIIALHNNYDGKFSVTSYLKDNEREKDAKAVHLSSGQDPDNLFLTTDSILFEKLRKEKFNAVLQDNSGAYKDGSLSIYCGEKGICYLNCETEHGKFAQYADMIAVAIKHTKYQAPVSLSSKAPVIFYKYLFSDSPGTPVSPGDFEIYFGEKNVGLVKASNNNNPQGVATGRMEIIKSFPLYDNMDFFLFAEGQKARKIELRIDPTRAKKIIDPEKATILVKIIP